MDDDDMAKYPGLAQRKGVWQVRKLAPRALGLPSDGHAGATGDAHAGVEAAGAPPRGIGGVERGVGGASRHRGPRPLVEAALACGSIEDLGRPALEGLVLQWWERRKEIRQLDISSGHDSERALANLAEEVNDRSRAEDEGHDLVGATVDRLLVELGSAAHPHRVGKIKTRVQYPAVNKETLAYHQLRVLVSQGLGFEQMLAQDQDNVTGDRTAPRHPLFNPTGSGDEDGC